MPKSTYTVERSVLIAVPPDRAYAQIIDFRNWRNWSVWEILDPELRRTYVGEDAGEGAAYTWAGNRRIGSGSMTIVRAEEPREVAIDLVFEKPLPACSDAAFSIAEEGEGCRVTWTMTGSRTTWMKLSGVLRSPEDWVGQDLERSLEELKLRLEERRTEDAG